MAKRITAYILFALGLLTVTFVRAYHGELLPYPALFWLLGAIMFVAGWAVLRYTPTVREAAEQGKRTKNISELKRDGEKIRVMFSACTIKSNDFIQEQELFGDESPDIPFATEAWDEPLSTKLVEVHESVVVYERIRGNNKETFTSEVIMKDPATLMFRLDQQKETFLYVDRKDRSHYFFDMDFLNEENPTA